MPIIQWTHEEPHNSTMFCSWGDSYRARTDVLAGRPTTVFCRYIGARETVVATVEWDSVQAPARIRYGRNQFMLLTDFLRLDSVGQYGTTRSFCLPNGARLAWTPDPRSHGTFLVDHKARSYGRLDPIARTEFRVGGKWYPVGHVLDFPAEAESDPVRLELILVTILLYRCLSNVKY
ncbi:hypothetical protein M422DRAFT_62531 [Sphaerobolus stellatus SS14]|nr:hypothetical protein M422DRAFT_62531 [Sphaerobolus stellatus SS14]